jgi:hypothetical protein
LHLRNAPFGPVESGSEKRCAFRRSPVRGFFPLVRK